MNELWRLIEEQAADDTDEVDQEILEIRISEQQRGYDDAAQQYKAGSGLDTWTEDPQ